jgi:Uma2 family endonuclease
MSGTNTTALPSSPAESDQRIELGRVGWDTYVRLSDAVVDRHNPRMIYLDGSLTLLTTSRRHDRYAEYLGLFVVAVANGCGIEWEPSGQATYRREDMDAGVEGDRTYYFREHAELMRGPVEIDLTTQPPPDLAIEVEVTHPADVAVSTWGRLGVPEVWRFDVDRWRLGFWHRREDATYVTSDRSLWMSVLTRSEVLEQMRLATDIGATRWSIQLSDWVRDVLVPRLGERG